jgi:hypothetical protein
MSAILILYNQLLNHQIAQDLFVLDEGNLQVPWAKDGGSIVNCYVKIQMSESSMSLTLKTQGK